MPPEAPALTSVGDALVRFAFPDSSVQTSRHILGGLKTKRLDVTVTIPTIGPALAVSLKGSHNAFRNLTNRMEEAAGDCTNLHMSYPALVYAFWHVLRANEADDPAPVAHFRLKDGRYNVQDVAVLRGGALAEPIRRYRRACPTGKTSEITHQGTRRAVSRS